MKIITDIPPLNACRGCALVPTMGALHEGHRTLVRLAAEQGLPVVVSIYVNPTQFAPHEDLDSYPRNLDHDLECVAADGAAVAFVPSDAVMYPESDAATAPAIPVVGSTPGLEDGFRPHFFAGVCRVVARLFDLVQPGIAVFGEKDWQQLKVIEAMVRGLPERWPGLRIQSGPTVREADGLAMSSRNAYLDAAQRHRAAAIFTGLSAACGLSVAEGEAVMQQTLCDADLAVDYAVIRDSESLGPVTAGRSRRGLVAATLDGTRLIDNMAV
jgi:pantoate--beta-alanine ligase